MNTNYPTIALGTWSWGKGVAGGDQVFGNRTGERELRPVFDEAMKNGLNLWDSAVVYGMGASETILASFTRERRRDEVLISTKFTPQIADLSAADPVAAMCESSLSRFGTDHIDMYWIHNPADVERWTPRLIPLVKSGKVRRVGVSNHNLAQIRRAEEILAAEGVVCPPCRTTTACSTARRRRPAFWITAGRRASTSGHTWSSSRAR